MEEGKEFIGAAVLSEWEPKHRVVQWTEALSPQT